MKTVFILGAGFSFEQGYPLARTMKEEVITYLNSMENCRHGFMKPVNGGFEKGQFYTGLDIADPRNELQFEELMISLVTIINSGHDGPCHITIDELRNGASGLLWKIHDSMMGVVKAYMNFAEWFRDESNGIISLNWDLHAEVLLDKANIPWGYFIESGVHVIKPHGSINWSQHLKLGSEAYSSMWKPVRPNSKLMCVTSDPLTNPELGSVVPQFIFMLLPGDPECDTDMNMFWQDALDLIKQAEKVVFIGYSFPDYDSHALKQFKDSVRDKKVVVINPAENDLRRASSILGSNVDVRQEKFSKCQYGSLLPKA